MNILIFDTLGLPTPPQTSEHLIKVLESLGLYIALTWIIFGTGFMLLCIRTEDEMMTEMFSNPLIREHLDFRHLGYSRAAAHVEASDQFLKIQD